MRGEMGLNVPFGSVYRYSLTTEIFFYGMCLTNIRRGSLPVSCMGTTFGLHHILFPHPRAVLLELPHPTRVVKVELQPEPK